MYPLISTDRPAPSTPPDQSCNHYPITVHCLACLRGGLEPTHRQQGTQKQNHHNRHSSKHIRLRDTSLTSLSLSSSQQRGRYIEIRASLSGQNTVENKVNVLRGGGKVEGGLRFSNAGSPSHFSTAGSPSLVYAPPSHVRDDVAFEGVQ